MTPMRWLTLAWPQKSVSSVPSVVVWTMLLQTQSALLGADVEAAKPGIQPLGACELCACTERHSLPSEGIVYISLRGQMGSVVPSLVCVIVCVARERQKVFAKP
jgi:hypothetical protein